MNIVKDKAYKSYDYISRYQSFPYYYNTEDNKYVYGTTGQLNIGNNYSIYVTQKNDSYDNIALMHYNSPTLYWIICDYNRIQDPFVKPVPGTRLKIPVLSNLTFKQE